MPTRPKTDALRKLEGTGGAYYFWSNAKGLYPLSNLHRCNMRLTFPADRPWVPPFLQGQTLSFVSAEHAYQCLKAKDLDDARSFTEQGCLSWWPEKGHADKRAKDQIGVVAKVAKHLQTRHIPIEHQEEVWDCIHAAKFSEGSDHGARLCATHPHPLVEFDRRAKDSSLWGAKITDGRLVGQNFMGRMLMRRRRFMLEL